MKNILAIVAFATLLCVSCEKEIEIDYKSIEGLYVIEGNLNSSTAEVQITRTRDMSAPSNTVFIDNAVITITDPHGKQSTLLYDGGVYSLPSLPTTDFGVYELNVSIGGEKFSAKSEIIDAAPEVVSAKYKWVEPIMSNQSEDNRTIQYTISIQDRAGMDNYYKYIIMVNDSLRQWGVTKDSNRGGKMIEISMQTRSEENFKNGDKIRTEVQSIDKAAYDYLYSVLLSERTSSNPINYFKGGCLGYFSAHLSTIIDYVFNEDDVEE